MKKYNEKIEDLSISYTVNGNIENYVEVKCSHSLKPMPEKLDATLIALQCGRDTVSSELVYQVEGYNRCIDELLGGENE